MATRGYTPQVVRIGGSPLSRPSDRIECYLIGLFVSKGGWVPFTNRRANRIAMLCYAPPRHYATQGGRGPRGSATQGAMRYDAGERERGGRERAVRGTVTE